MSLFCDSEEEPWDRVIGPSLKGVLYTCRAVMDHVLQRGRSGNIVSIWQSYAVCGLMHLGLADRLGG